MYLAVAMMLVVWLLVGRLLLAVSIRSSTNAPSWLETEYRALAVRRVARLRVSTRCARPISFGIFRPTILLPASLCEASRVRTLRHVLLHEQTHVDRHDSIGNALINWAAPLLWFHPLYWYLRSSAAFDRELIADDRAAMESDKLTYVNDLLDLIRLPQTRFGIAHGAIGMLGFRHPFTRRMSLLLDRNQPLEPTMKRTSAIAICAAGMLVMLPAAALLGTQKSVAQDSLRLTVDSDDTDQSAQQEAVLPRDNVASADEATVGNLAASDNSTIAAEDLHAVRGGGNLASHPQTSREQKAGEPNFISLKSHGLVQAVGDLNAYSPLDAQVKEVEVQPGTLVKKGDVIMRLENLSLEQETLALRQKLYEVQSEADSAIKLRVADADFARAKANMERTKQLHEKQVVSDSEWTAAQTRFEQATLQVEAERVAVQNAKRASEQLERQYELAVKRLEALDVRAPLDGVVEEIQVDRSAVVAKGARLFRIIDLSKIRVRCAVGVRYFSPGDLNGKAARIDIGLGNTTRSLEGTVTFIGSTVDVSGTMEVWITADNHKRNGDWVFRPGMRGLVHVAQTPSKPAEAAPPKQSDAGNASAMPPTTSDHNLAKLHAREIQLLKDLVQQHKETFHVSEIGVNQGTVSKVDLAYAGRDLWTAEAKLAIAEKQYDKAEDAYLKAIQYAETVLNVVQHKRKLGDVDATEMLDSQRRVTELRLEHLQLQKRNATR